MRARALLVVVAVVVGLGTFAASPARACATTNTPIAFVEQVGCDASLWIMASDGSAPRQLTALARDTDAPRWSPDGTRIVFSSWSDGGTGIDVWIYTIETAELTHVPTTLDQDYLPDWSPDGSRIAFVRSDGTTAEIWTMGVDGSALSPVTSLGVISDHPSWSPDGTLIVFTSNVSGRKDLYTIHPDGSGLTRLTSPSNFVNEISQPQYSRDGSKIVATALSGHGSYVVIMDADGSNIQSLTTSGCLWDESPSFTIDGTHVLFTRPAPSPATYSVPVDRSTQPVQIGPVGAPYRRMSPAQAPPTTTTTTTTSVVQAAPRFTC